jgi:hypothetical protein
MRKRGDSLRCTTELLRAAPLMATALAIALPTPARAAWLLDGNAVCTESHVQAQRIRSGNPC